MIERALRRLLPLRSGEFSVALLMFAYSFLAMSAWNIVRPVTRSKFIDALGADNLPYVQLAAGVLIGVLMHLYTGAISRLPRRLVIPVTQSAIIAVLVAFSVLLRSGAEWVTVTFYFVGLILGLLLISQFWTLANDLYDARQAKRLFGLIGAGSSLGGALGAQLTAIVVRQVGSENLLLVAAVILGLCIVIVRAIDKRKTLGTTDFTGDERGVGGGEAIALLRESRHLRVIALVVGFAAAGGWIIEQQLNMAAEATRGPEGGDAIAAFLAQVNALMSLAGFVVQVTLTSRLHRSVGLVFALLLLPVSFAATAIVILVSGALWAPAVARGLDTTLRYTIDKTSREMLFLPLPAELKYRAKPFIDVTMDRVARALAALLVLVLIKPWGLGLDWRGLSYASLTMTGLWIAMALVARRDYLESFRASIGERAIAPEKIRTNVGDSATVEALVENLSSPEEEAVLYAIDMLEALDRPHLITPLLLHHESPRVRARTLHALATARSRMAVRWTGAIERMMQDVDVDVRAAALRAVAVLSEEDPSELMRRHLEDPEPRIAVAAATALARSQVATDVDLAEAAFRRLVADSRDAGGPGRTEVAAALGHLAEPRFRPLLVPLLYDSHLEVVRESIRSARAMGASDGLFLPGLVSLLGHRLLKAEARDALVGYGEGIVPALDHAVRDQREHIWIRRHIPSTLALMPTQASMDALVGCLSERDGFLRYKAIAAIEQHRREHPGLRFPRAVIESLVVRETAQYYNCLTLRHNLSQHNAGRGSLLDRALDDKMTRTLDRIFRLVGLLYNMDDVAAARYSFQQGEGRRRAAAVEYLDNLLKGLVRKRVLPILEDTPIADKVRFANQILNSRPRDVEDTLAQLVHDDDPVLAATAIHFVVGCGMWSLADDLEFVRAHRPHDDRPVGEAASWALARRDHAAGARSELSESLPAVEVVDRVRRIPLFEFVPVDELFRIASLGRESRHPEGQELERSGEAIECVECLLEGAVQTTDEQGRSSEHRAPSVFGLEEVLQGAPVSREVRASEPVLGFQIRAADFMTMISDSVWLTQGLFRTLLAGLDGGMSPIDHAPRVALAGSSIARTRTLQPVDQALLLRRHPLLGGATASQLLAFVGAAHEVPLVQGQTLFEPDTVPALYLVLDGALLLKAAGGAAVPVVSGSTVGVAETLAGRPAGWHAVVTENGRALRLGQDELFAVLTDNLELTQALFSGALALRASAVAPVPVG